MACSMKLLPARGAALYEFAMMAWRLIGSQFIATAIADGGFAVQKIILLTEEGQLNGSRIVDELNRYGYQPARTYLFSQGAFSSTSGHAQTDKLIEDILDTSRKETIQSVLVSWNERRTVDRLMDLEGVLTVPVHLLPDCNVAHFLGNRVVNLEVLGSRNLSARL
jgi:hypothetical protein